MKCNIQFKSSFLTVIILLSALTCLFNVQVCFADSSEDWPCFHNNSANTGYSTARGPTTSQMMWKYKTGQGVQSSPAVANGVVYVGSYDDNVYALNATTGEQIWNYTTGNNVVSSPAVANGVVYIGAHDGVYALNATTGEQIWSFTGASVGWSSPTVANEVLYIGSGAKVYALNVTTGEQIWSYTTGDFVYSSPAVAGGVVYVGSYDDNVYALNAITGEQVWSFTTEGKVYSSPAVANGIVCIGSYDDNVYALNATTGDRIWNYTTGGNVMSSPAVANGVVYVGSADHKIYALNAITGRRIWSFTTGGKVDSSPAVANAIVYIASSEGIIYALNATRGTPIWLFSIDINPIWPSPAVANGVLYIGSIDGNLFALGQPNYKVNFVESGLNSGINWSVTFDGITKSSTTNTIDFNAPAGEYSYSIITPTGYITSSDLSGTITIYDVNIVNNIVFTQQSTPSNTTTYFTLTMYVIGNCTVAPGNQTYVAGTNVNLEALASEGWTFAGWSGDVTETENTTIVMDSDRTVTATFVDETIPEFPSVPILVICIMFLATASITLKKNIKLNHGMQR